MGVPSSWHVCPVGGPPHSWSISILCSSNKMFQAHCPRPATACSFQWGNDIRHQSLGTRCAHCYWAVFASWPFGGQNIHTYIHSHIQTHARYMRMRLHIRISETDSCQSLGFPMIPTTSPTYHLYAPSPSVRNLAPQTIHLLLCSMLTSKNCLRIALPTSLHKTTQRTEDVFGLSPTRCLRLSIYSKILCSWCLEFFLFFPLFIVDPVQSNWIRPFHFAFHLRVFSLLHSLLVSIYFLNMWNINMFPQSQNTAKRHPSPRGSPSALLVSFPTPSLLELNSIDFCLFCLCFFSLKKAALCISY